MNMRRHGTYLTAGLLATASAATLYQALASAEATRRVEAAVARIPGLHVGSVSVGPWNGRVVVSHVTGKSAHAAFSAGRIVFEDPNAAFPQLISPAHAASGTATAENIEIDFGTGKVHVPKVEASGTDLSSGDLAAIFDPKSSASLTERMSKLTADSISMPELSVDVTAPNMSQKFVYKDIKLEHVEKGKIAEYTSGISTLSVDVQDPAAKLGPIEGTFGASSAKNLNMGLYARIMTESRKDPDEAFGTLYDSFVVDGIEIKGKGFSAKTGKVTGAKVMARPFLISIADFQKSMPTQPGAKPTPEQTKKSMQFITDIYDSMDFGTTDVKDVVVDFGKNEKAGSVKIARMGLADFAKARLGELSVDGLAVTGPEVLVKIESFALRGFNFKPAIDAMKTIPLDNPAAMGAINPRTFLPSLEQILVTGIDASVPDKRHDGNANGGATDKFKIGKVEIKASNYLLGIPAALAFTVEHLALDLPPPRDANARQLAAMGYTSADVTSKFAYAWSEAASTLTLTDASLKGEGMGSVSLKGVFGNITKDLFVGDAAVMQAALLGAAVAEADLRVENDGLVTKLLDSQAKQAGVTADQLRDQLIMNARQGVSQLFGDSTQASAISDAVSAFLKDPKSIEIVAKSAKGLSAADLPLLQNLPELLRRLDIQATANR